LSDFTADGDLRTDFKDDLPNNEGCFGLFAAEWNGFVHFCDGVYDLFLRKSSFFLFRKDGFDLFSWSIGGFEVRIFSTRGGNGCSFVLHLGLISSILF